MGPTRMASMPFFFVRKKSFLIKSIKSNLRTGLGLHNCCSNFSDCGFTFWDPYTPYGVLGAKPAGDRKALHSTSLDLNWWNQFCFAYKSDNLRKSDLRLRFVTYLPVSRTCTRLSVANVLSSVQSNFIRNYYYLLEMSTL